MPAPAKPASAAVAVGGIDLGGTKIEAIVTNASYKVLGGARHPTPTTGGPADVANAMAAALTEAAKAASLEPSQLRGVGVGSPGTIDTAAGTVSRADNLPGWYASFPLAAALHSALGTTIALGNDVSVATNAEFVLGAGRPYRSLLGVFWGTGVGGGLILDGQPWHGRGGAGEIGHTVINEGGRRCPCGRRGCPEGWNSSTESQLSASSATMK